MAATGNDMPNVTFHNDLALAIAISHKGADKLAGIVKGNFVRLLILGQKVGIMGFTPGHSLTGKNCVVNSVANARMIGTVQICQIENFRIFIAENIHVIFKQDTFIG